jgi:large subunit ribosomal protein L21
MPGLILSVFVTPTSPPLGVERKRVESGEVKIGDKKMKYAIVECGGKQYKAVEGTTIEVDLLTAEAGESLTLESVLLIVDGGTVKVGTPTVKGMIVKTTVVEHFKGEKIVVFRYRPKKRYRVKTGHRQQYTRLKVESIG